VNELLAQLSQAQLAGFFLVLARVSPLFVVAPLFSSRMIPLRARGIVAVAIALGLAPLALHGRRVPLDGVELGGLIVKELLVGLAFAFAVAAVFAAVSAGASFLDTLAGFSFGALVDPLTGNNSSVLTQLYGLVAVMIFIAIGGDAWLIEGLSRTYDAVPLLAMPSLASLVGGVESEFAAIFRSALEVVAPVLLALVITDAGFGVVARVVPQLNVFVMGFPVKIIVALVLIAVSLPFAGGWISSQLQQSVGQALQTLRVA
jgi:flagellar biosynthesis protein FliR